MVMGQRGESSSDDIHRPTPVDSDSEDEQPLVRSVSVPPDVVEVLEHDLCERFPDPATTQLSSTVPASLVPTPADEEGREDPQRVGTRPSRLVIVSQDVPETQFADGVQHHAIDPDCQ